MPNDAPSSRNTPFPSGESVRAFSCLLRRWYRQHGRDLPWRRTRDPYRVLVSEFMLQQTQVSRVLDFYTRFLERFPTLRDVAAAPPRRVLEQWSGLGYYARARHLHTLAREVARRGAAARLPSDPNELRALPGVGAYTAGAIASFAYERRTPLVDTNVARVLRRVFAPGLREKSVRGQRRLWQIAQAILPRTGRTAWWHNQALIELGAVLCTARVRHCPICPVSGCCRLRQRELAAAKDRADGSAASRKGKDRADGRAVTKRW